MGRCSGEPRCSRICGPGAHETCGGRDGRSRRHVVLALGEPFAERRGDVMRGSTGASTGRRRLLLTKLATRMARAVMRHSQLAAVFLNRLSRSMWCTATTTSRTRRDVMRRRLVGCRSRLRAGSDHTRDRGHVGSGRRARVRNGSSSRRGRGGALGGHGGATTPSGHGRRAAEGVNATGAAGGLRPSDGPCEAGADDVVCGESRASGESLDVSSSSRSRTSARPRGAYRQIADFLQRGRRSR